MALICRLIANQQNLTVSASYPHVRHLKLADPLDKKQIPILTLTGTDFCHSFFLDEIIRGNKKPVKIINSYLGYITSRSFSHIISALVVSFLMKHDCAVVCFISTEVDCSLFSLVSLVSSLICLKFELLLVGRRTLWQVVLPFYVCV